MGRAVDTGVIVEFSSTNTGLPASSESDDAWEGFLRGLGEHGLACPLLVISDGAPGLIGAVESTMGAALPQRCLIHPARINGPSWPGSRGQIGGGVAA